MTQNLLVVDDEESICWGIERIGQELGCHVLVAASAEAGLELAQKQRVDVIMTDVRLPGKSGLQALPEYRRIAGNIPIIVITAHGDLMTAVEAVRQGAFEYLVKPFNAATARQTLTRALAVAASDSASSVRRDPPAVVEGFVAGTAAMQEVFSRIALAARSDAHILLTGESGTGKELAARAVHRFSQRASAPFVTANLAALSPTLIESELFGHCRGAFTGADRERRGLLQEAHGGTLFLDEVADIPAAIQVKLLRVLEEKKLTPVGSDRSIDVDFRVVCATHRDLLQRIHDGAFRHDLYFRLAAFQIHLPPLRDRRQDIGPLANYFLRRENSNPSSDAVISEDTLRELERRPWWGNVRELRNCMEFARIVSRGTTIEPAHLPAPIEPRPSSSDSPDDLETSLRRLLKDWTDRQLQGGNSEESSNDLYERLLRLVEPTVLQRVVGHYGGQFSAAARRLGLHRSTLKKKLNDDTDEEQHET